MESQPTSAAPAEAQSGTPPKSRLAIRIKLPPQVPPQVPAPRRLSRGVLLLILGIVAVLLSLVGISMFRTEPTPAPAVSNEPLPKPVSEPTAPRSVEPAVTQPPAASPSAIHEVIPDVPRSARETIRGTIRVSVRVVIDQQGTVLAAI